MVANPSLACYQARLLAELLGKRDDDALRPADIGQPVRVLVLHFANELGPVGAHVRDDSVKTIDGEHDATEAQRVHRPKPDGARRVELVQLDALPVGRSATSRGWPGHP